MSYTDIHPEFKPDESTVNHTFGILTCLFSCILSASASISIEALIKTSPHSLPLMQSNALLYTYGILSHLLIRVSGLGFKSMPYWFEGYNFWGAVAVVNGAGMGLVVSLVVERINSMAKVRVIHVNI